MGCKTDLKPEEKQRRVELRQSKMTLGISKLPSHTKKIFKHCNKARGNQIKERL